MKYWALLIALLFAGVPAWADGMQSQRFTTTGTSFSINLLNTGIAYHKLTWNVTGTVSGCSVELDSSPDGVTWTAGGVIGAQTCTSNGNSSVVNSVVNYVRIDMASFTGPGSVNVTWNGYVNNPGGGGGGAVSSVFGRTGAVTAQSGDYTCSQATGCGPNLNVFYISASCGSLANCLQLTDDDSTDNCGSPLTAFLSTINGYSGPGIPQVSIYGGSANSGAAFKFSTCVVTFSSSVNVHVYATIDCGQSSGDCFRFGATGLGAFSVPGVAGATIHGPSTFSSMDGTGTFIGGANLTTGGIHIPSYQNQFTLTGSIQFINFGPGNGTVGNCTSYAIDSDLLNEGTFNSFRWWSWDTTAGRCAFRATDSSGMGLATVVIKNAWIAGGGSALMCASEGINIQGAHDVVTDGTSVAGFGVPIRIAAGGSSDTGTIISSDLLDVNGCIAKSVKADIWLGGNGSSNAVSSVSITDVDVHGGDINSFLTKAPDSTAAINLVDVAHNASDNGSAPVALSTDACSSACTQEYNTNMSITTATNWSVPISGTLVATDDFHRANAATLGANWKANDGGGGFSGQISSNVAFPNRAGGLNEHWVGAGVFSQNQYCEIVIKVGTPSAATNYVGCGLESASGTTNTAYEFEVGADDAMGPYITKVSSGSGTTLVNCSSGGGYIGANGDVLRFEATFDPASSDVNLRVLKNGVPLSACSTPTLFQYDDTSTPLANGTPGIWFFGTGTGTDMGVSYIRLGNL